MGRQARAVHISRSVSTFASVALVPAPDAQPRRMSRRHLLAGALSLPTLEPGEDYAKLLADRSAFEDYQLEEPRTKGYGFARIQRYAIEHLLGAR